jgi:hypothetical protein
MPAADPSPPPSPATALLRGLRLFGHLLRRPSPQVEEVASARARLSLQGGLCAWLGPLFVRAEQLTLELEDGRQEQLRNVILAPEMAAALRTQQACEVTLLSTERIDIARGGPVEAYFVLALKPDGQPVLAPSPLATKLSTHLGRGAAGVLVAGLALSAITAQPGWAALGALGFVMARYVWAQLPAQLAT